MDNPLPPNIEETEATAPCESCGRLPGTGCEKTCVFREWQTCTVTEMDDLIDALARRPIGTDPNLGTILRRMKEVSAEMQAAIQSPSVPPALPASEPTDTQLLTLLDECGPVDANIEDNLGAEYSIERDGQRYLSDTLRGLAIAAWTRTTEEWQG